MSCILLRSSWQSINIGDIGHTPGMLSILETYLPEVDVILWPCHIDNGVGPMLKKAFPRLKIADGKIGDDGRPDTPELQQAFEDADFFLHSSAPAVVAEPEMKMWSLLTGRPYGVYGVTVEEISPELRRLLSGAEFIFCRDTASLKNIQEAGVSSPCMEFGPDATFAITLRDDKKADNFLAAHGLKEKEFICAIPRLRYTPYYKIHQTPPTEEDLRRERISEQHRQRDMSVLRDTLISFIRQTAVKVLACPEMIYEMELAKEELIDPMPEDVKPYMVWREHYWTPDEAASVYARARALISMEMHSPIIALKQGTPSIYLRLPSDTIKGQMWRDIGLPEWIFEVEETESPEIAAALITLNADYSGTLRKSEKALDYVQLRQKETAAVISKVLNNRHCCA
ncbi:MAG: polysaccharide pyruvyl transferase family protein [Kiritimatiellales bacterium]